jgi:hypothetical protein
LNGHPAFAPGGWISFAVSRSPHAEAFFGKRLSAHG